MTTTDQNTPPAPPEDAPGPFDGLKGAFRGLGKTVFDAGVHRAGGLTDKLTTRLSDFAEGKKEQAEESDAPGPVANAVKEGVIAKVEGENPATAAIKGALGGVKNKLTGGGGGGKKAGPKYVNIVEWIDVGVPVKVAYNQWTQFEQWSEFMKKVENVQRNEDQGKVAFKGQVFLSHRSWEATLVEMVPDDHIVWQSTGQKGYINGGVTFHEVAPRLTRMCVVFEYHPQGFVEKTLNIWRSVGRASRRELKRYVHQVMTQTILDPDAVEGWRAEVRDKEIVRTHDEVVEQEQQEAEEAERQRQEAEDAEQAEDEEGTPEAEAEAEDDAAESGTSEAEADAAEDDTYLGEAGVGPAGDEGTDEQESDEEQGEDDEDAYDEEPAAEHDSDEQDSDEQDSYDDESDEEQGEDDEQESDEEEPEEGDAEDEYESDDESEEGDESDDEGGSDEDADDENADEYEDEGDEGGSDEESDDENADDYDDEGDESDDEYESEDENADESESDDENADENEDQGDESEGDETEGDEGAAGESGDDASGADEAEAAPTPKDVASGSVHPTETRRPRTKQRA